MQRLRPTQPIFDPEARRGSVSVGTSPSVPPGWMPDFSLAGTLDLTATFGGVGGVIASMVVRDGVLYVGGNEQSTSLVGHVFAIDITDPTDMTVLGSVADPTYMGVTRPRTMRFKDNDLLVVSDGLSNFPIGPTVDNLFAVDVANPSDMVAFARFEHPLFEEQTVQNAAVVIGNTLIMTSSVYFGFGGATSGAYIISIDITDPSSMSVVNSISGSQFRQPIRARVVGDVMFMTCRSGVLAPGESFQGFFHAFDVSDPEDPTLIGSIRLGLPYDFDISGNYAFVSCDWYDLMYAIDISDPTEMVLLDTLSDPALSIPAAVKIYGGFALVSGRPNTVSAISITNPSSLSVVDTFSLSGIAESVIAVVPCEFDGNHMFISSDEGWIYSVRLGDPV